MKAQKERYEVFGEKCKSFKEAAEKAVDMALNSRESVPIAVHDAGRIGDSLTAYINVTASLELP